jgi:hypothetical protein
MIRSEETALSILADQPPGAVQLSEADFMMGSYGMLVALFLQ